MGLGNWLGSKLPSWVRRQPSLTPEARRELQQEYQIPLRDGFNQVRGWRDLGIVYEIAGGDPYKDPAITAAIRVFDPDMIPMTIRWTFLSPADAGQAKTETFVRHAIGRYISTPHYQHEPLPVVLPPLYAGPVPNQIDLVWSGELFGMRDPRGRDLPGDFLPWDGRLLKFMEQAFHWNRAHTVAEKKKHFIHDPLERAAKQSAKNREEQHYINQDIRAYVEKQLAKLGEPELKAYFLGGKFKKKARPLQIAVPGAPKETPRPKQPTLPRTLYGQGETPSLKQ